MKPIRNSAKAIIISDGHLLAIRNFDEDGEWYLLPGGGQNPGENLIDALMRECWEEIGANVRVHDLRLVREYIGRNHEHAETEGDAHQVEFMFECEIEAGYTPRNGPAADTYQIGVDWLPIAQLGQYRLYPQELKAILQEIRTTPHVVYLGDVN